MPKAINSIPAMILTIPKNLFACWMNFETAFVNNPVIKNGIDKPAEYANNKFAPTNADADEPANTRILASIGPTHGDQPKPNV